MHVEIKVSVGPTAEGQRTVLVTADEYIIGATLDAIRYRLGYALPADDDDIGDDDPSPPSHQPRASKR